eukprot:CAMPEP_0119325088 /NCGR_PEP_ID=MMETSP1333-20130426/64964_1 /TAXON_ID=418940 /ORGANISM="Scyphosphaera apsteinii, Strain RCC1455" /LENGTH=39 /DNA_ID= /DNA_START= /DNA_END= /DNA_ORIENTATION=
MTGLTASAPELLSLAHAVKVMGLLRLCRETGSTLLSQSA